MRFDLRVVKGVKGIKGGREVVLGLDELNGVYWGNWGDWGIHNSLSFTAIQCHRKKTPPLS